LVDFFLKHSREIVLTDKRLSVGARAPRITMAGNAAVENVIERAVALSLNDTVTAQDLPARCGRPAASGAPELPEDGLDLSAISTACAPSWPASPTARAVQTQAAGSPVMSSALPLLRQARHQPRRRAD
jgi:hypothetical protein